MSPAEALQLYLIQVGVGGLLVPGAGADWSVYLNNMPDTPDNAICAYDTTGRIQGRIHRTGETIEQPGVQVKVRGTVNRAVCQKIKDVADALDACKRVVVVAPDSTCIMISSFTRNPILNLGNVPGNRVRFAFTVNAFAVLIPAT